MMEFCGLGLNLGYLSRLSKAKSRSISPENLSGDIGQGGMATEGTGANRVRGRGQGWKISPSIEIQPRAVRANAAASLAGEPGGLRFDVLTPRDNGGTDCALYDTVQVCYRDSDGRDVHASFWPDGFREDGTARWAYVVKRTAIRVD